MIIDEVIEQLKVLLDSVRVCGSKPTCGWAVRLGCVPPRSPADAERR